MPRILAALFVALIAGILAMPASARAHGHDHAGHRMVAATEAVAPVVRSPSGSVSVTKPQASMVAARVAPLSTHAPCDRDCDHAAGLSGCSCMAACLALTLPDTPAITPATLAAGPRPGDAAPWRPTALVPPTPPPRA